MIERMSQPKSLSRLDLYRERRTPEQTRKIQVNLGVRFVVKVLGTANRLRKTPKDPGRASDL
jgi:hypothetical protein